MTKLEQIKRIATQTCCGIVCDTCSLVKVCDERSSKEIAKVVIDLLSYDSDFSKSKVGDWAWTTQSEWVQIEEKRYGVTYPIALSNTETYTLDGKFSHLNKIPSAFIKPPLCFNPTEKPEPVCQFKRGDKVLVSNHSSDEKNYRYFAEYIPENLFPYFCFVNSGDEWSSKGKINGWEYCEAYKGETE